MNKDFRLIFLTLAILVSVFSSNTCINVASAYGPTAPPVCICHCLGLGGAINLCHDPNFGICFDYEFTVDAGNPCSATACQAYNKNKDLVCQGYDRSTLPSDGYYDDCNCTSKPISSRSPTPTPTPITALPKPTATPMPMQR